MLVLVDANRRRTACGVGRRRSNTRSNSGIVQISDRHIVSVSNRGENGGFADRTGALEHHHGRFSHPFGNNSQDASFDQRGRHPARIRDPIPHPTAFTFQIRGGLLSRSEEIWVPDPITGIVGVVSVRLPRVGRATWNGWIPGVFLRFDYRSSPSGRCRAGRRVRGVRGARRCLSVGSPIVWTQ
jgi:hypothetical protein